MGPRLGVSEVPRLNLSSRERAVLRALAIQEVWPARTESGWRGEAADAAWVPDSRRLLARLAARGLVADESTLTVRSQVTGPGTAVRDVVRARRFSITEAGREAAELPRPERLQPSREER